MTADDTEHPDRAAADAAGTDDDAPAARDTRSADDTPTARDHCTADDPHTARDTHTVDDTPTARDHRTADDPHTTRDTHTADDTPTAHDHRTADGTHTTRDTRTTRGPHTTRDTRTTRGPHTARAPRDANRSPGRTSRLRVVRLGPASAVALLLVSAVGVAAFGWPLLAGPDSDLAHSGDAPWLFAALLPLLVAVVGATIADSGLDAKAVAMLGVLAAVGAALRPLGAGTAGIEPMFFLMVLSGRVLGPGFGFVLGAVTMFASALLTGGVGPWMPFQMLAMGWVSMGAGLLPGADRLRGRRELWLLATYGAIASVLYGTIMNLQGWPYLSGMSTGVSFVPGDPLPENLARFVAYCLATSLGWDLPRAVVTAVCTLTLGRAVLAALRRATRKAAFGTPVTFEDANALSARASHM